MSSNDNNNDSTEERAGRPSNVEPRAPTTTMSKVRQADRGEAPATEPGAISSAAAVGRRESEFSAVSGMSSATGEAANTRREARRNKRAATREKYHGASADGHIVARNSAVSAPDEARASYNEPYPDDDDYDDDVDVDTPGSFAVAGPALRRSQQEEGGKPPASTIYENRNGDDIEDHNGNDPNNNLPVAFEAEIVFDYPNNNNSNVVVAQKDDGNRVVPLKWFLIGGSIMFIAAVAISVGLGVALGGSSGDSNSSDFSRGSNPGTAPPIDGGTPVMAPAFPPMGGPTFTPGVAPTFTPTVAHTFTPTVAHTFTPVVPPSFTPVVPPTFSPAAGPTAPVPAPTFTPVVPPTFTPVVPPTFAPAVAPTFAPTVAPTFAPAVAPTFAPVVPPTFAPVVPPTFAPVVAPTSAPVEEPTQTPVADPGTPGVNPLYLSPSGLSCQCRWYVQDIVVSDASDYSLLSEGEISGFLSILLELPEIFDPYLRRTLMGCNDLGSSSSKPCLVQEHESRKLIPSAVSYALDLGSQTRFGNPGAEPFGLRMTYNFEFCVDDAPFVSDYHEAFLQYFSNAGNREQMAADIRDIGISSTTSVTIPNEQEDRTCSGRR